MSRFSGALRRFFSTAREAPDASCGVTPPAYCSKAPDPQNALDIFTGEWTSRLPPPFERLKSGSTPLFEDERLLWAIEQLGGVERQHVLELGPLEGGHTYLLDRAGAARVLAIESNPRAYLRSLVIKELLGIASARFVHGDFLAYLRETSERFDLVIASGVLYHMVQPVELIARIGATASSAYFWTHYYDRALFEKRADLAARVVVPEPADHAGFAHQLYRSDYGAALHTRGFCGGAQPYSHWLTRDDIMGALTNFGFSDLRIAYEQPDHPHGPALAILATR